jgi:hypothetical protein
MAVRRAVAEAEVVRLHDDHAVLNEASNGTLLLVNRAMEPGYHHSNGVDYIKHLRTNAPRARLMLVSNLPHAQNDAVAAGALPGFGKDNLMSAETTERLRSALTPS